ncbi:MAG TPA: FtsX-like permease family protein, partial [Blastocatellia bacterium]|nr:FtsX-like permease family protein [Blastocatellia bacterium]
QDLWTPLALDVNRALKGEGVLILWVIARLKPGVTLEAASSDLSFFLERLKQAQPKLYSEKQVRVARLSEQMVRDIREALLALFGAVAFILLIACANVANLLLARASTRQKEMAIRAAVGAGRFRLVRQLLTESLTLSLLGGLAGLLVATLGVKLLVKMNPGNIARLEESAVDGRALGFTCAVSVIVGLLAGILPALRASKTDVNGTLKAQSASWAFVRSGRRTLPALMIAELTLTLVLTVGAGLLIRSFLQMVAVPKGFNPDGVLTLELAPNHSKYPMDGPQREAYFQELLARVQALPGIQSAGLTSFLPLAMPELAAPIQVEGRPPIEPMKEPIVFINHVSRDYFRTMGMQVRAGRPFSVEDGPKAQPAAIINETVAQRYFSNENPIGRRFSLPPDWKDPITIVGVVGMGLAGALALTRVMKSLLFNVSATDPATFVGVTLLLVAVALIASYIPARRATKVDPLQSLRQE